MKIGIAAPLSLASVNGGVRTQVLQTAHHLRLLNVDLEFIQFNQEHFNYDLVHVFAASPETIGIAHQIKSIETLRLYHYRFLLKEWHLLWDKEYVQISESSLKFVEMPI